MAYPYNLTNLVPNRLFHPRVLGRGSSKMVWFVNPGDEFLVMNADPTQVYNADDSRELRAEKREIMMYKQKTEFYFTHAIRAFFPLLIPEVKDISPYATFQDSARRFRYLKERCELLPLDDTTFPRMIGLLKSLYESDLVYLDIKPENLGILRDNLCIIDTDPDVFYRVPDEFKEYYIYAGFITCVLYAFHYVPRVNKTIIRDFVAQYLTPEICDDVFARDLNRYRIDIARASLPFMEPIMTRAREDHPRASTILDELAGNIQLPMEFIVHYGTVDGIGPREKLEIIRNWTPAPVPMDD
jgi:hypothetical protein